MINLIFYICALNKITRLCRETCIHVPLISSEKHKKEKEEMIKCAENTIKVGRCCTQGSEKKKKKKIHLPLSTVSSS